MQQSPRKTWFRSRLGAWLAAFATFLTGVALLCILFVRRDTVDYYLGHEFSVRDSEFFPSAHALADPLPINDNKIELLHNGKNDLRYARGNSRRARKRKLRSLPLSFWGSCFTVSRCAGGTCACGCARAGNPGRHGFKYALDDSDVKALKEAGCSFAYYHAVRSWRIDRANRRTHRRVLVVDGRIGFTGGVGFSDEWDGDADAPEHWRDVHARLEGPIVGKLQAAFQEHWFKEVGETLSGKGQFPELGPAGNLKAQVIASHSFSAAPLSLVQAVSFSAAQKSIYITNAYCAPSSNQTRSLVAAVKRGVDVRHLLPGKHNDQPATKAAGRTAYGELLKGGVKIYEFQPTMIHSKTMVVDGIFSVFGSSNFDARSAQINEELDISVYDEAFGREMQAVFERDRRLKAIHARRFQETLIWERLTEWLMLPFHSQV